MHDDDEPLLRVSLCHKLVSYEALSESTVQLKNDRAIFMCLHLIEDIVLIPSRCVLGLGLAHITGLLENDVKNSSEHDRSSDVLEDLCKRRALHMGRELIEASEGNYMYIEVTFTETPTCFLNESISDLRFGLVLIEVGK